MSNQTQPLVCVKTGCGRRTHAKGLCNKHYVAQRRKLGAIPTWRTPTCSLCHEPQHGKGYCQQHYNKIVVAAKPRKPWKKKKPDETRVD